MRFLAPVFVLLWSTGFIGAKYGLPYAEPLTFLSVRFIVVAGLLGLGALALNSAWPTRAQLPRTALVGGLLHGVYLGGVFVAISWGLDAGPAALITSMSPVATAALSRWRFGERLSSKQLLGMALGLAGVLLVVGDRLEAGLTDLPAIALCFLAMVAMALAAVEQRAMAVSAGGAPSMIGGNAVQYLAALGLVGAGALAFETRDIAWTSPFVFALGWLSLVLSIGAISLLYLMLQRGAAAEATSLVFLTPASTAVIAYLMFGETLDASAIAGFAIGCVGVALTTRAL